MKNETTKNSLIEHASREDRFKDERREVFLRGYYSLIDLQIQSLEEHKVNSTPKTNKDE